MIDQPPSRDGDSDDLLLDIVETLETCGLCRDEYQRQEYVDAGGYLSISFERS